MITGLVAIFVAAYNFAIIQNDPAPSTPTTAICDFGNAKF